MSTTMLNRAHAVRTNFFRRLTASAGLAAGVGAALFCICPGLPGSRAETPGATDRLAETEHNTDKLVPIISVGTGLRVGAALVTGPSSRVSRVAAVGQLEGKWKNVVEARVLIPVANPAVQSGLSRVPEVSVYAVGNVKL